ncbi:tetratricopeptide repeat containing protein [Pseudohyphozyma bogoriensis]|nr:tetratricopeptide repeat containing protein [Pseudohyphozyma bogoriensis]
MSASSLSTAAIIAKLHEFKTIRARKPEETVKLGEVLLQRGFFKKRGDAQNVPLEQLAVAAIECGNHDLADLCTKRLSERFPNSPRVAVLLGELLEGEGKYDHAKVYYEELLKQDETDVAITKRLIALHLHCAPLSSSTSSSSTVATPSKPKTPAIRTIPPTLSREHGIKLLVEYLDTFYSDTEGWSELASVYCSMRLYPQALTALSHLLLLAPQNPYHLLHHAEVAYTTGDYPLAYKEMLRVIEMSDGVVGSGGVGRRAAMGVKLCIAKLEKKVQKVEDPVLEPKKLKEVDLMVTKLILGAYDTKYAVGLGITRKWVGSTA